MESIHGTVKNAPGCAVFPLIEVTCFKTDVRCCSIAAGVWATHIVMTGKQRKTMAGRFTILSVYRLVAANSEYN